MYPMHLAIYNIRTYSVYTYVHALYKLLSMAIRKMMTNLGLGRLCQHN